MECHCNDDSSALMAAQRQQVFVISRDGQLGVRCDSSGDLLAVISIGGHHARHGGGLDDLNGLDIISRHLGAERSIEASRWVRWHSARRRSNWSPPEQAPTHAGGMRPGERRLCRLLATVAR